MIFATLSFLPLIHGLFTAYLLYEEVMSVRLYDPVQSLNNITFRRFFFLKRLMFWQ